MSGGTQPKMHVRDAIWVVYDGAAVCLFIRMSWEDNMDDEVVVGGMILDDFGNLFCRKSKIAS